MSTKSVAVVGAALVGAAAMAGGSEGRRNPFQRANVGDPTDAGPSFVNFENHPIHGLEVTPDGSRLLVTNTADNRLEVFDIVGATLVHAASVPVGLDPVSVRARTSTEAWVVNHISDSVSIVDLNAMNVVGTIDTADEPFDLVFAGSPQRVFVSCSQVNRVQVFDPASLPNPVAEIVIGGEDPRAMAVSPDGSTIYVAVWESGNGSTILGGGIDPATAGTLAFPPNVVSDPAGPYGGQNPPPNKGNAFDPPIAPGNGTGLKVGLIVKKNSQGQWMDDNGGDWTAFVSGPQAAKSGRVVGWDLPDRDLAVIDANTLSATYVTGLMNMCMAVGVNPTTGKPIIVGTDAINEVRFEPNVNGVFVRVHAAIVGPGGVGPKQIVDLNPHLTYSTPTVPQTERDKSIGDPRAVVFMPQGDRAFVTGMGSNNVIVIDAAGNRAGQSETIEVGEGPTSLALNATADLLYVLNRFEGSVSIVDTAGEVEIERVAFFDPTPAAIKAGRPHFYDTQKTSGLGQASCASCHVDGRFDRLAWDLGDPSGAFKSLAGLNLGAGVLGLEPTTTQPKFEPFHAMKGPMTTQTLIDIIGKEPHHWRGDRLGLEEFNPAFEGLLGDDEQLTSQEMQEFEDFLATTHFPPNPFRNFDDSLPTNLPLAGHYTSGRFSPAGQPLPNGNPVNGRNLYTSAVRRLDGGAFACVTCHTINTGAGTNHTWNGLQYVPLAPNPNGGSKVQVVSVDGSTNRAIKTPQLRSLYEKVGCEMTQTESLAGFGFLHDGSVDSLARFVSEPAFDVVSDQEVADLVAFLLCFSGEEPAGSVSNILFPPGPASNKSHAAVGAQTTLVDFATAPSGQLTLISQMNTLAANGKVGLVVKGVVGGQQRGYYRDGTGYQSDRAAETLTASQMLFLAKAGQELTFTVVPKGSEIRIGVDRDEDGYFDRDELERCADPADPGSYPGAPGNPDCDQSGTLDLFDFLCFVNAFNLVDPYADCDGNTVLDLFDFLCFVNEFNAGCP